MSPEQQTPPVYEIYFLSDILCGTSDKMGLKALPGDIEKTIPGGNAVLVGDLECVNITVRLGAHENEQVFPPAGKGIDRFPVFRFVKKPVFNSVCGTAPLICLQCAEMYPSPVKIDKTNKSELRQFLPQFPEGTFPGADVFRPLIEEKDVPYPFSLKNCIILFDVQSMKFFHFLRCSGKSEVDVLPHFLIIEIAFDISKYSGKSEKSERAEENYRQ